MTDKNPEEREEEPWEEVVNLSDLDPELQEKIRAGLRNPLIIVPKKGVILNEGDIFKGLPPDRRRMLRRTLQGKPPRRIRRIHIIILVCVIGVLALLAYLYFS